MINVEREYKRGIMINVERQYKGDIMIKVERECTINFPGSSSVRINQMRVVERTKMDE